MSYGHSKSAMVIGSACVCVCVYVCMRVRVLYVCADGLCLINSFRFSVRDPSQHTFDMLTDESSIPAKRKEHPPSAPNIIMLRLSAVTCPTGDDIMKTTRATIVCCQE